MRRIVLAGPIGSGKSTVASLLAARGATVIEADRIGHDVISPDGPAFPAVAARWPDTLDGGSIDRRRLAAIVFADPNALLVLEALTHPHIAARIEARADAAGAEPVVIEMPLTADILGVGWPRLVVLAPAGVRFARAEERGMDPEDVRRRMDAQPPDADWRSGADWVIDNDGSRNDLEAQVDRWWAEVVDGR